MENVRQLKRYFNSFIQIVTKLKRIVRSTIEMNNNQMVAEAF